MLQPREPLLRSVPHGDWIELAAGGAWTAEHAHDLEPLIEQAEREPISVRAVGIDMSRVERIDTFGAWLLERLVRTFRAAGCQIKVVGLSDHYDGLIEELHHVNLKQAAAVSRDNPLAAGLAMVGRTMFEVWRDLVDFARMLGELIAVSIRVAQRPHSFRLTSTVNQLERVGWRAVPIVLLITFLIGSILAQQGIFHFRKFGADIYVIDMVGVLVLREVGVIIVAVMVAGRSGSAYTAELGSMRMREEVDALRTMGFDPTEVLILPRIAALLIAVPILTFLGSMSALYGGALVAWGYGGINPDVFLSRLKEAISLDTFEVGMIKAPFMALVIGIVACVEGFKVQGSSESLGLHTTASVVKAIFMVIVLDGLFAMFFASIGK
jgi:phospholipid/cholesterol/gamma-HCH transport system permease protein